MSKLVINRWVGRLGNNILQLIRALHYGKINKYNYLVFPENKYIINKVIKLEENIIYDKSDIYNTFFNIKNIGCNDPNPYLMKKYFNKYIYPIMKMKLERNIEIDNSEDLHIHIRAGDIFQGSGAHGAYIQPPLKYYKDIIESKKWEKIIVVYEDLGNPCVQALKNMNYNNIYFESNKLEKDLNILCKSKNMVLGFGTFGLLLFFLNLNIKNIYIPKYVIEELPKGNWGDINLNIIDLPNYIKCGEWKNTKEQKRIMLNYK